MHGLKRDDFYKTPEEKENFKKNLEKGYKLLDLFVEYSSKIERRNKFELLLSEVTELDSKMFDLSEAIIEFMPEFCPSWNYRKKYIQKTKSKNKKELVEALLNEMEMTLKSLKRSPKSYSIWHHRLWTTTCLFNLEVDNLLDLCLEEYKLCFKLFKLDGRNFHCWSYFNFIRHYLSLLPKKSVDSDDLAYGQILSLINTNFSNYSAWFQRSNFEYKLQSHKEDLELIKNALYTDPQDQSLWNYYDWFLFKRNSLSNYLCCVLQLKERRQFILYFNVPVSMRLDLSGFYKNGDVKVKGTWNSNKLKFGMGSVWTFQVDDEEILDEFVHFQFLKFRFLNLVLVVLKTKTHNEFYSHLLSNPNCLIGENNENKTKTLGQNYETEDIKLVYNFRDKIEVDLDSLRVFEMSTNSKWVESEKFEKPVRVRCKLLTIAKNINFDTLKEHLKMVDEIIEIDSESKYLLIAKYFKTFNKNYRLKILEYLDVKDDIDLIYKKLSVLDPLRKNYYLDMLTNYRIKSKIQSSFGIRDSNHPFSVNLSNISLSRLDLNTFVPFFGIKVLDLSHNKLTKSSIKNLGDFLVLLESLNLSNNDLNSLKEVVDALGNLSRLKMLNLSDNPLEPLDYKTNLDSHIKLEKIDNSKLREINVTNTTLGKDLVSKYFDDTKNTNLLFGTYQFSMKSSQENGKNTVFLVKLEI